MTEQKQQRQVSRAAEPAPVRVPVADVCERQDAFVVTVDMPGVDEGSADIDVERNVLTIQGRVVPDRPEGYQLIHSEYDQGDYRRSFVLSNEIGIDRIEAAISQGVLQLVLPKAEAAKPRKISVKST